MLLYSLQQLSALPSDWRQLDTPSLLAEAALAIEKLKRLNEELRKEASESREQSEELANRLEALQRENEARLKNIESLQAALGTLQTDWSESEKMRRELENALASLQASLKSCREEAKAKSRKAILRGFLIGASAGLLFGLTVEILK